MSYKIYLIKHLDTDMKYVGITGADLPTRWQQHYNDTNSAVYKALRTEGYRMTMELLEEVATKPEALKREQEYICSLGTATPSGWNRQVATPPKQNPKKWKITFGEFHSKWQGVDVLQCPSCDDNWTHQHEVKVYNNDVSISFWCEQCHSFDNLNKIESGYPPLFKLLIHQHKGQTTFETVYYIEDKS